MARGTQFRELIDMLRAELNESLDRSVGTNALDRYKFRLRHTQRWLYEKHSWPFLNIRRDENLSIGERLYSFDPDLPYENVHSVWTLFGTDWQPVEYGITPAEYNSLNEGVESDPVLKWAVYEDDQYEIWPAPASKGVVRMYGKKKLRPLIDESDRAMLDDTLIVLYAAAATLAKTDQARAETLATQAASHFEMLRANNTQANPIRIGAGQGPARPPRPGLDYIAS